jgi:hypothetical protein
MTEDLVGQAWAQNDAFNRGDWEAFRALDLLAMLTQLGVIPS